LVTGVSVSVASAALLVGTSGCSFSVGGSSTVKKDDVVSAVTKLMTDPSGRKPDKVECPDDLKFEVNATTNCQATAGGKQYKIVVTVTKLDGDQANFSMVKKVPQSDVVKYVTDTISAERSKPDSVTCPGDLEVTAGTTMNCTAQIEGKSVDAVVILTSADPLTYELLELDKAQVAQEISDKVAEQVGRTPDSVTCPANLPGKVGATLECDLVGDGQTYGVAVTVTSVEGTNVKFDFKVADQPK
jgi:hypothetical protein